MKFKRVNNLKVLSLFSGIGAFEKALTNLNIDHEVVNYCEIDKYASKAYSLIHNIPEDKNLWDITKVDEKSLPKVDLITYGFPCQDISQAGKQAGIKKGTRSGLLFDALRIIESCKPKYAICENVKALVGKKFKSDFENLLAELESYGYTNYWKVLNAKNFGIPQNRERVFVISILNGESFTFPEKSLPILPISRLIDSTYDKRYEVSSTNYNLPDTNFTIIDDLYSNRVPYFYTKHCPTLRANRSGLKVYYNEIIRRLTPSEYLKFSGFSDFDKIKDVIPHSKIYKMAGNSIVVNVLEEIFKELKL